ncbi:DUF6371 domain-containing protein [Dyadobacter crusticola]|uniref:DUF6371 domain-containing protein n=1 Tax=Dyadobacter crusticola TaxID=292407 RepID=UPI0004E22285|nr:DUF6371 domain-containing protein [Dyadobacter crusticola]
MTNTAEYQYTLKKYKTPSDRITCPSCGARKSFAPYIDVETGQELPENYGRCNRADSCGYHLNPYKDGFGREDKPDGFVPAPIRKQQPVKPVVNLPRELLKSTYFQSEENTLIKHLARLFSSDVVKSLRREYLIGNHDVWPGSAVFWFVSQKGNIRAGQVKQFDESGHTVKINGDSRTVWIHKLVPKDTEWLEGYENQDMRVDCLFGEHLLDRYPGKPIALFESPKTAIIATPFFPKFLCLAMGALDYFTENRISALKGRKVILYPDLSPSGKAFHKWSEKAEKFKHVADFKVSEILEKVATDDERIEGLDMADYLERIATPVVQEIAVISPPEIVSHVDPSPAPDFATTSLLPEQSDSWESEAFAFDLEEHWDWLFKLPQTAMEQKITLTTLAMDKPYDRVCDIQLFLTGRLNYIQAFTGRSKQGNRALFIRQVTELRESLNTI